MGLRPILILAHVLVHGTPPKGILADTLWNPGRKLLESLANYSSNTRHTARVLRKLQVISNRRGRAA